MAKRKKVVKAKAKKQIKRASKRLSKVIKIERLPNIERGQMTSEEYRKIVARLGLSIRAISEVFGIAVRQSQRIAAGNIPPSDPARKMMRLADHFGVTAEELRRL